MRNLSFLGVLLLAVTTLFVACEVSAPSDPAGSSFESNNSLARFSGPLDGAIFTTTVDGSIVNENVRYEAKEDVYLDGGPGPNAPPNAAGLPAGDYYYQVTDPSGKDLLSTDHIQCRKIRVNEYGVIDHVYMGYTYEKVKGQWTQIDCQHNQGVDIDHSELGAITVQLYPYDDTPNNGGVYKVWITRVEDYQGHYDGGDEYVPGKGTPLNGEMWAPGNAHGFINSQSKTDNYKVLKRGKPCDVATINLKKFHDANANGVQDEGEEDIVGWDMYVTDPSGVTNLARSGETILAAEVGTYTIDEANPLGTMATTADPLTLEILEECGGEVLDAVFGNVGLSSITATKIYDRNGNGAADDGEPVVEGILVELSQNGTLLASGYTGADGTVTFGDLLPGTYTITEVLPAGWVASGSTSYDVTVSSSLDGSSISGSAASVTFTNYCEPASAGFGTKGYWHNKNGLAEIKDSDIVYANSLPLYSSASDWFTDGDEPFDGLFSDGSLVAAAYNNDDVAPMAGEGSARAEISHYLIHNNGTAEHEQLGQQLLAFIFNALNRLDDPNAAIQLADGSWATAQSLIDAAVAAWESDGIQDDIEVKDVLDAFNNMGCMDAYTDADGVFHEAEPCVLFIPYNPCAIVY